MAVVEQDRNPGGAAWVFPGQGSQRVGMAHDLIAAVPAARAVLDLADAVLGFGLSDLIAQGPAAELERTDNQQPAILAVSVAWLTALRERELLPPAAVVAGHSLGEYSAMVATGALAFEDALRLVRRRGELMAERADGGMAAVIGLDLDAVRVLADAHGAEVANVNAPGQVVVSGPAAGIEALIGAARAAGARRAIRLAVSGAFHSSLMRPMVERLAPEIETTDFHDPTVPIVSNVSTALLRDAAACRRELIDQICAPVQWVGVTERIVGMGVTSATEIGPGKVLTGLIARIAPDLTCRPAESLIPIDR